MKLINVDVNVALVIVERVERCVFLIALGCGHVQLTGSLANAHGVPRQGILRNLVIHGFSRPFR